MCSKKTIQIMNCCNLNSQTNRLMASMIEILVANTLINDSSNIISNQQKQYFNDIKNSYGNKIFDLVFTEYIKVYEKYKNISDNDKISIIKKIQGSS